MDGGTTFGGMLRGRRVSRGWTQEQLANNSDLSTRYVQALEADRKSPSLETLFKLCRALNTSPGPFLAPLWNHWKGTHPQASE